MAEGKSPPKSRLTGVAINPSMRGRGPKPGAPNAGRPRNEFRDWCAKVVGDPARRKVVEAILDDSKHPAYATMWKAVAERAHGKPEQTVQATGDVTIRVIRE